MSEWRLFPEGEPPEWTTPEWYADRETAPHLEQEGHRERLLLTAKLVNQVIRRTQAFSVVDLGAGDGGLLSLIKGTQVKYGFDLQQTNVDAARKRGVDVKLLDVVNIFYPDYVETPDIVIATEILEHLADPHALVTRLYEWDGIEAIVASSPYTENDEHHYDFHTWAWDLDGYRKLFEDRGWRVTAQETAWISQVIVAER